MTAGPRNHGRSPRKVEGRKVEGRPMPVRGRGCIMVEKQAKFAIGQLVKHRMFPFRGVIFDVDPEFANTEEWYQAIPEEIRPAKDQPFYHLLAENAESYYVAYVSEQNLLPDASGEPMEHPQMGEFFGDVNQDGLYEPKHPYRH